ncbi:MAG TPA: cbb3-type cytochrome c oxidase subunit 3 [Bdellovibrio sp.]|uniref:cbb3-type cytochrome oxidase subunit 3 n=1 Tax=Bdellovibrio sp. TaxID=28201 RepID=UPI002F199FDC
MKEGLAYFTDTYLTVIGLAIFMLFFCGVLIWVNRKMAKGFYKEMEQLPLKDGEFSHERF